MITDAIIKQLARFRTALANLMIRLAWRLYPAGEDRLTGIKSHIGDAQWILNEWEHDMSVDYTSWTYQVAEYKISLAKLELAKAKNELQRFSPWAKLAFTDEEIKAMYPPKKLDWNIQDREYQDRKQMRKLAEQAENNGKK